jgi:putative ABC transport system permease protein
VVHPLETGSKTLNMIRNFILLFFRNLRRQKLFSAINLLGLTVSIASTLLIYLYVQHEFSYDNFHHHSDRLYRVNQTFIWSENANAQFSRTGPGVAHALIEELPEVEVTTSLHTPGSFIISYAEPGKDVVAFEENKILAADSNFFKVLNFELVKGDARSAFLQANNLVMTESTAKKYFGNDDPIGKLVQLGNPNDPNKKTYEVTGVLKDTPANSTIEFDVLLSSKGFNVEKFSWSWVWTQLETFVLFRENTDMAVVERKLQGIPRKRAEETLKAVMNTSYDEYIASGKRWDLYLQPINSLHLPEVPVVGSFPDTGNIKIIYSLIGAAIFIVLLSCVNFMNLSAAQFTRRIKEASVRKIMGLGKRELRIGHYSEALIFCILAACGALAITQLMLPAFNTISGKALSMDFVNDQYLIIVLGGIIVLMALVSGSYPALFLTGFNPVEAIKGKFSSGRTGKTFRNALVVFQFSVSIVLMVCTAVVFQQLQMVAEKDPGFNRENLVVLSHAEAIKNPETLLTAIKDVPGAKDASWCNAAPPSVFNGDSFEAEDNADRKFNINFISADQNYIPTLGIRLKFGRNFSEQVGDSNRVILNETAVKVIGWKLDESVIGKKISYQGREGLVSFEVVGVVSDFHYWSMAAEIEPLAVFNMKSKEMLFSNNSLIVVKVNAQSTEAWEKTLASLQTMWKQNAGDAPFQYSFVDQSFADTFKTQQRFSSVLTVMAVLAILIACLGLLGMIIYSLEQRTREIGIRKVSGASIPDILLLISRGYTLLIVIAFVIAAPIAYWMTDVWLRDFAYRVSPSPWIFLIAGLGTLAVSVLITGYHSLKAAIANPIEVLKDE